MGNCGVGFAPCPPGGEQRMIELMEGVEDIPGTALYEGIEWGRWETFPEYIDYLGSREYALDVGTQIPHSAVRNYVMGDRALEHEDATADDLERIRAIVQEGLVAGALGFSTSRTPLHVSTFVPDSLTAPRASCSDPRHLRRRAQRSNGWSAPSAIGKAPYWLPVTTVSFWITRSIPSGR